MWYDALIPLVYIIGIIGASAIPLKYYFKHKLQVFKTKKQRQTANMEEEYKNWILTAIQNPNIALKEIEKEIQDLEVKGEKGFSYSFAMLKKQGLEFAAQNPQLAQYIGPDLVEKGFKLWKKVPKILGGLTDF